MPKTIAITPSWYWPTGIARVIGVPPFSVYDLCIARNARRRPTGTAIITGETRMTFAELDEAVRAAAERFPADDSSVPIEMSSDLSLDSVIEFLGGLAAGAFVQPSSDGGAGLQPITRNGGGPPVGRLEQRQLQTPAVRLQGRERPADHSHHSLMAMVLAFHSYLDLHEGQIWMVSLPLHRWEGITSLLVPLYLGAPAVLLPLEADAAAFAETIEREQVAYAFHDLPAVARFTREAKKEVKRARKTLLGLLLVVNGPFEPDQRRRAGRGFDCPALTVFGLPETGPIFAAHPSWYLDESVGLPITNAHVVPADLRTGTAIQVLWELVESAEVTIATPALMCREDDDASRDRLIDGRYRTGMIASSDPNGMIYLLGE
jgi:acyl-CoA synthetase (AMP-forming)/AMP-acid ligase II